MNINLNSGGIIGAIAGAIFGGIVWASHFPPASVNVSREALDQASRYDAQVMVGAVLFGAVGGTVLWSAIFRRKTRKKAKPLDEA